MSSLELFLTSQLNSKALAISSDITDAPHPVSKVTHLISVGLNDNSRSLWEKEFLFSSSQEGGISSFVELLFVRTYQVHDKNGQPLSHVLLASKDSKDDVRLVRSNLKHFCVVE